MRERPSWDDYFMSFALIAASRSTCVRGHGRHVGAVIVADRQVLATGYNGAPKGVAHCAEVGCLRDKLEVPSGERHELCRGIHAEQNALLQAAGYGTSVGGATLYTTLSPCSICLKMIINAGIERVIYLKYYNDPLAEELREDIGLSVVQLKTTSRLVEIIRDEVYC